MTESTQKAPSSRRGRHRGTVRGDSRRDELVHVASELFAENGYRDTSIADIAQRVGVTQQALLYYFGSKPALLDAVIDDRDGAAVAFAEELAAIGGFDAIDALPDSARRNAAEPNLVRLFAVLVAENLSRDAVAHDHFVTRYRRLRRIVAGLIAEGQRTGVFEPGIDPALKAAEVIAVIDGLNTQWLLDPDDIDIVAVTEQFAEGLAETLRPRA
ncbi:TetR/AcrR family transcriptional regulator [Leifsonia sp. ZF2019]|uniref:TetR/AcrR family transcriptional regulator n=1 Tax=Leifsonia sp. ZF2019 TaxID=2781978 RepID=UPI001CBB47FA|nr:TetR/AcrR family transcriptional regulator [Leifsonia sp. ZF2019]UAJ79493.1 TetR/AcrR family transcriptional regulator [Leifsonia sp. ZF2019]